MNKEIEYLKEHLYEIYKYKKSMKDLTYDMDLEHLSRTCKALDYQQKEIERLQTDNKRLLHNEKVYQDRIKQKDNIIKEVREYIENNSVFLENDEYEVFNKKDILEILDKVGEDNE